MAQVTIFWDLFGPPNTLEIGQNPGCSPFFSHVFTVCDHEAWFIGISEVLFVCIKHTESMKRPRISLFQQFY